MKRPDFTLGYNTLSLGGTRPAKFCSQRVEDQGISWRNMQDTPVKLLMSTIIEEMNWI